MWIPTTQCRHTKVFAILYVKSDVKDFEIGTYQVHLPQKVVIQQKKFILENLRKISRGWGKKSRQAQKIS